MAKTLSRSKIIIILGPTASGKSELAVKLAKKFNGEIISADSRQIYKELNIGTAKPTKKQRENILHYLIDVIKPDEEFNVAIYKKLAIQVIKDIQRRRKLPFLVGGTGLYLQAVVENIEFPRVPAQRRLREKLEKKSPKELFEIYKELDPGGAKFIERENKRRLIRAIEVCKITKKPFWQQRKKGKPLFEVLEIGIKLGKEKLKERIEERVEKMFKMGLEKEVKNLVEKYDWISPLQTIGYQEWKEYFEGKISRNEVKQLIIQHSIRFAKRQMTWFKKYAPKTHWISPTCHPYQYAEKLVKKF